MSKTVLTNWFYQYYKSKSGIVVTHYNILKSLFNIAHDPSKNVCIESTMNKLLLSTYRIYEM